VADSRERYSWNAERAGRLSRKDALHRMYPTTERALLPTRRGEDDECALVPTALICLFEHSEASRPTDDHSAARALQHAAARRAASRETRRGSAGPANERASAAVVSWAAGLSVSKVMRGVG
jgi:hypothetical protein